MGELDKAAEELGFNLENAPFWRPRFARFAEWFAGSEAARRAGVQMLKSEVGGKLRVEAPAGPFEITARADRIDRLGDGRLRIYDFKTSANAAKVSAGRGAPQLALEGLLAKEGAFAGIPAGSSAELFYIVATGGEPPGEIVTLKVPCADAIQAAYAARSIASRASTTRPRLTPTRRAPSSAKRRKTILMRISPASASGPSRQTTARPAMNKAPKLADGITNGRIAPHPVPLPDGSSRGRLLNGCGWGKSLAALSNVPSPMGRGSEGEGRGPPVMSSANAHRPRKP